jgi:hypothetical protein
VDDNSSPLPMFFDVAHAAHALAIVAEAARRRSRRLDANKRPLSAITTYNNLNAWCVLSVAS